MTEEDAKAWLNVPHETLARLIDFEALLREENQRQNLVSTGSLDHFWCRHIADSAQLVPLAPASAVRWVDLGTGAGFPGLVAALLHPGHFTLVEARRLRVEFLVRAARSLGLSERVEVLATKAETAPPVAADVISARALAPLDKLLSIGERFSRDETVWLLPKGRNAKSELDAARASWQGDFRLEPSLTDADAQIIVATGVRRKAKGKRTR